MALLTNALNNLAKKVSWSGSATSTIDFSTLWHKKEVTEKKMVSEESSFWTMTEAEKWCIYVYVHIHTGVDIDDIHVYCITEECDLEDFNTNGPVEYTAQYGKRAFEFYAIDRATEETLMDFRVHVRPWDDKVRLCAAESNFHEGKMDPADILVDGDEKWVRVTWATYRNGKHAYTYRSEPCTEKQLPGGGYAQGGMTMIRPRSSYGGGGAYDNEYITEDGDRAHADDIMGKSL